MEELLTGWEARGPLNQFPVEEILVQEKPSDLTRAHRKAVSLELGAVQQQTPHHTDAIQGGYIAPEILTPNEQHHSTHFDEKGPDVSFTFR
mmetsp:Transcript_21335/g.62148  ORF Transcript_21335/g.62148 Transcript_21335/m.62148 type:complete len:91 (-) Transcript_21335:320-592(-)